MMLRSALSLVTFLLFSRAPVSAALKALHRAFWLNSNRAEAGNQEFVLRDILAPANTNTFATGSDHTVFYEKPDIDGFLDGGIGSQDKQDGALNISGGSPEAGIAARDKLFLRTRTRQSDRGDNPATIIDALLDPLELLQENSHGAFLAYTREFSTDINFILGFHYAEIDRAAFSSSDDERHESYYIYHTWRALDWLTVDAALQYDDVRDASGIAGTLDSSSALSPRLGIVVRLSPNDSIRVAGVHYQQAFSATNQFDPTDIAGIPIVRNDFLTKSDQFSLIYEREWNSGFVSAEWHYRESELPFRSFAGEASETFHSFENGSNVALNQLVAENLGLAVRFDQKFNLFSRGEPGVSTNIEPDRTLFLSGQLIF